MSGFQVDLDELANHASAIERTQPFTALAEEAAGLPVPSDDGHTAAALGRLRHRVLGHLTALAADASTLGHATSYASDEYWRVESSVAGMTQD